MTAIADRKPNLVQYINQILPYYASIRTEKAGTLLEMCNGNKPLFQPLYEDSINLYVARNYGITGPVMSIVTACASANNAIEEMYLKIKNGLIDCGIAGGANNYDLNAMMGFSRLGALSSTEKPDSASRPFDKERNRFVMGSGCGILILESYDYAIARGAKVRAEIVGYSTLCDAYRATDTDPSGKCATKVMIRCMEEAGITANEIGYINAHGTSTQMNDLMECRAIKAAFGKNAYNIPISSTKSMIGHSIMAAAAIKEIVCMQSLQNGEVHPTRNCVETEMDFDFIKEEKRTIDLEYAMSNSFGFGGQNTLILIKKYH